MQQAGRFGSSGQPQHSTLLMLVQSLADEIDSDEEIALVAADRVNRGQVVLTGNFRGCRLALD